MYTNFERNLRCVSIFHVDLTRNDPSARPWGKDKNKAYLLFVGQKLRKIFSVLMCIGSINKMYEKVEINLLLPNIASDLAFLDALIGY